MDYPETESYPVVCSWRYSPPENFSGLHEDLSMPHVFPLEQIKRVAPLNGKSKIFAEASRHLRCPGFCTDDL
jgi:hypothetical protein